MEQNNEKLKLHSSKVGSFLQCRKKYWYEYEECLAAKDPNIPLQVGDIVHKMLHKYHIGTFKAEDLSNLNEIVQAEYQDNEKELSTDVAIEAGTLIAGYITTYREDFLHILSSEVLLECDMGDYILISKVDAIAEKISDGTIWRLEHKTTKRMDSLYMSGLKNGIQGAMYEYLISKVFDDRIKGTIYNILVKTKIPQYARSYASTNLTAQNRVLETLKGVARDIKNKDFYPSSNCYYFNKPCEFLALCNYDCEETRNAFYKTKAPLYTKPIMED
jgi:hypothetical protein